MTSSSCRSERRPGDEYENVSDAVSAAARAVPDSVALIGQWGTCTWLDLDNAVRAGTQDLVSVSPGERVVLALPTGPDLAAVLFATMRAGLVAVPIDPARHDAATVADRTGAGTVVMTDDGPMPPGRRVITSTRIGQWWANNADSDSRADATDSGYDAVSATAIDHNREGREGREGTATTGARRAGGEDLALLARAGRDGPPVMLSHRALVAGACAVAHADALAVRSTDRVLQVLPLFHVAGLVTAFLPAAMAGAAVVVPDPSDAATRVESLLAAVRHHRVTVLVAEPTLYRQIDRVEGFDRALASVRVMTSGSSPLYPADFAAIRSATGQAVREGYGISEAAAVVTSTLVAPDARVGSVGLPYPGTEVRIIGDDAGDDDGESGAPAVDDEERAALDALFGELTDLPDVAGPDGDVGLIAIRGSTLFSGYWPGGDGGPGVDGWFVTGDIGYLDDQGELHLVDRAAETIAVDGFTVYPREIEDAVVTHPLVADAVVVAVPGDGGSRIVALLVAKPGARPTADDVRDHVSGQLASYKRPADYELVDELRRTPVGRLDRESARVLVAARRGIDLTARPAGAVGEQTGDATAVSAVAEVGAVSGDQETVSATAVSDASDAPPVTPEPAAGLDRLGRRLPADRVSRHRSAEDTDDDLF